MKYFKDMSEDKARDQILDMVREYCDIYHVNKNTFHEGDKINYAGRIYDHEEMVNLVDSSLDFWLTSGRYTEEFEREFAKYLQVKFAYLVNSGSSANLLAFNALTSHLLGERKIKRGDEVITVACGFSTTVAPIIQYGAIPVFVDVTIPEYNIDASMLEKALSPKTKAVMIAHTMGNPFDLQKVKEFCDIHNLWLIEDNCDALGSEYYIDGEWKLTGTIGDIGTSSFYPPHHMTMGEGGAVYTNNPQLARILRSMRDWGRDCVCPPGKDNVCGHRFDKKFADLPKGYDHKYVSLHLGYNLKATDMQAAVGCAQLKKLPRFIEARRKNFQKLYDGLKDLQDKLILPEATQNSKPSWFGFLISCGNAEEKNKIVNEIEAKGIQTRMLFSGDLLKHPAFEEMKKTQSGYRVVGSLEKTDNIMESSFWIGVYPGMTDEKIEYMIKCIHEAVRKI